MQTYGWTGWLAWAKNGAVAGSQGLKMRIEAYQVVVMVKSDDKLRKLVVNGGGMMPEMEIEQIKNSFINELSPVRIYLFGSFAKGTANEESDFDFYIVVRDGAGNNADLTARAYKSIRNIRNRAVDIIVSSESEFERRKNGMNIENEVNNTGVVLFG